MDPKAREKERAGNRWFPGEQRQGGARELLEAGAAGNGGDALCAIFELGHDAEYVARLHEAARYRDSLDGERGMSHEHFSLLLAVPEKGPRVDILRRISETRNAQEGLPAHPSWHRWLAMLTQGIGEVADAVLEGDRDKVRRELEEVAALAVAALEFEADPLADS